METITTQAVLVHFAHKAHDGLLHTGLLLCIVHGRAHETHGGQRLHHRSARQAGVSADNLFDASAENDVILNFAAVAGEKAIVRPVVAVLAAQVKRAGVRRIVKHTAGELLCGVALDIKRDVLVQRIAELAVVTHCVVAVHAQVPPGFVEPAAALAKAIERRKAHALKIVKAPQVRNLQIGLACKIAMHNASLRIADCDGKRLFLHINRRAVFKVHHAALRRLFRHKRARLLRKNHRLHRFAAVHLTIKGIAYTENVLRVPLHAAHVRTHCKFQTIRRLCELHPSPLLFVLG